MKRKRRKIFQTPEDRAAWEAKGEAIHGELQGHIERITAELESRGERPQDLETRIERIKAELEAKRKPA